MNEIAPLLAKNGRLGGATLRLSPLAEDVRSGSHDGRAAPAAGDVVGQAGVCEPEHDQREGREEPEEENEAL